MFWIGKSAGLYGCICGPPMISKVICVPNIEENGTQILFLVFYGTQMIPDSDAGVDRLTVIYPGLAYVVYTNKTDIYD